MEKQSMEDTGTPASRDRVEHSAARGLMDRAGLGSLGDRLASRGENVSQAEAENAVERARRVGNLMDDAIRVPGTGYRIGLDPLLGIVPVSGDAVAAVASMYILFEAFRVGVPYRTLATMLLFVGVDFLFGSVPVLGPFVDAALKVNRRNAETLESYVQSGIEPSIQ